MPTQRYFLELFYRGTDYSGFQVQENAPSIQHELEKALKVLHKDSIVLTGSSRTDAGVHALQNFFHFDYSEPLHPQLLYKINAILPADIVVKMIYRVPPEAHCRFQALSRTYHYHLYHSKNPFLRDRSYYFPYPLDLDKLQQAAALLAGYSDFTSFSKRNSQVKTKICRIQESRWVSVPEGLVYEVKANRFLRGMVRGMTGTMLQVGRGKLSLEGLREIIEARDCRLADFAVPGHGLFLVNVEFPPELLLLPLWPEPKKAGL